MSIRALFSTVGQLACSQNLADFLNCEPRENKFSEKMKYLEFVHDSSGHGRHSASGPISDVNILYLPDILFLYCLNIICVFV